MKKVAFAVTCLFLFALPVSAARQSFIIAGDGPFTFGQSVEVDDLVADWATNRRFPAYEVHVACQAETGGLAAIRTLSGLYDNDPVAFGPTPSWREGPADCTLSLVGFDSGLRKLLASDTFEVAG